MHPPKEALSQKKREKGREKALSEQAFDRAAGQSRDAFVFLRALPPSAEIDLTVCAVAMEIQLFPPAQKPSFHTRCAVLTQIHRFGAGSFVKRRSF